MARTEVVSVTTVPLTCIVVPTSDHASLANNGADADQAEVAPVQIMAEVPQLRYRQRQVTSSSTVGSGESEQTLAPISSQDIAQDEAISRSIAWSSAFGWVVKLVNYFGPPQIPRTPKMQEEYNKIHYNHLEDHVDGVPRFSAFQDSSEEWSLFRRFGPQAARTLIKKEVELQEITEELHQLDKDDETNPANKRRLRTTKQEMETKGKLENRMEEKLNEYYDLLLKYAQVKSLRPASARDHHSVFTYIIQRRPFKRHEDTFFLQIEDLVYAKMELQIEGRQNKHIEDMVEQFASPIPGHWLRNQVHSILHDRDAKRKADTENIYHFSRVRRTVVGKLISASLAVAVILIPVLILYLGRSLSPVIRAVIVGIFVFIFLISVSVLGDWGAHELFILMAAYTAILVALLSNLTQNSGAVGTSK